MRKLILKMSVSLDGFVGRPNGEIDWIFKTYDEAVTAWTVESIWQAAVHVMGSRTYQDMAAYWPTSTEPFAAPMNEIPKAIFSRRGLGKPGAEPTTTALKDARARYETGPEAVRPSDTVLDSWLNPTVFSGDLADDIATLKREPGKDIVAHGGAQFAQSLARLGLIDEYRLLVHPVALGEGLALFSALEKPINLRLVSATVFPVGVVAHVYRPA